MYGWPDNPEDRSNETSYLKDFVDVFTLPEGKAVQVRFIGPIHSVCWHWFRVQKWAGGYVWFPKLCLDYNGDAGELDKEVCPYCKARVPCSKQLLSNAIIRDLQNNRPRPEPGHTRREEREVKMLGYRCHLKDPKSESWTPVRVLEVPSTMVVAIKDLEGLNRHEGRVYPLSDPYYGMDVILKRLKQDSQNGEVARYSVQRARNRRLTEGERKYLIYPLDVLCPESPERAKLEWRNIKPRLAESDAENKSRDWKKDGAAGRRRDEDVKIINLAEDNEDDNDDDDKIKVCRRKRRRTKSAGEKSQRAIVIHGMTPLFQ
jgi:hypothetical protein